MYTALILIIYISLISSSILMISAVNPINSVLFLICSFLFSSIIFILLGIDFFGFIFLIIYVGAIAVLFLFIVMMLNIQKIQTDKYTYLTIGVFILVIFFLEVFISLLYGYADVLNINEFSYNNINNLFIYNMNYSDEESHYFTLYSIALLLFQVNPLNLILAGLNLLIAMIGAIALTNNTSGSNIIENKEFTERDMHIYNVYVY